MFASVQMGKFRSFLVVEISSFVGIGFPNFSLSLRFISSVNKMYVLTTRVETSLGLLKDTVVSSLMLSIIAYCS